MTIYDEIEVRRAQQIAKGYDAAHDDEHTNGEIAKAASAYAAAGAKNSATGRDALAMDARSVSPI